VEIEKASTEFEADLEVRCVHVTRALTAVKEAEDAQAYAVRQHCMAVDKLLALQERRVKDLHAHFLVQLKAMKAAFEDERDGITASHSATRAEVMHFLKASREDAEASLAAIDGDFTQTRETLRRKGVERVQSLQTEMDSIIESLEAAFEDAHGRYLMNTEQRVQDFKALAARGQYETHMKERQERAIARLQDRLVQREAKLLFVEREEADKNGALREERAAMVAQVAALKAALARATERGAGRVKRVSTAVAAATAHMHEVEALASRVLTAAKRASDMEPLGALIVPCAGGVAGYEPPAGSALTASSDGMPTAGDAAVSARVSRLLALGTEPVAASGGAGDAEGGIGHEDGGALPAKMESMVSESDALGQFYRRYNAALATQLALETQRQRLRDENAALKAALAECVAASSFDTTTLAAPNPLLVVNSRGMPAVDAAMNAMSATAMRVVTAPPRAARTSSATRLRSSAADSTAAAVMLASSPRAGASADPVAPAPAPPPAKLAKGPAAALLASTAAARVTVGAAVMLSAPSRAL